RSGSPRLPSGRTPEGSRRYKSEPKDTLVATLNATTDGKGEASVKFTPSKPGTLRLIAEVTDSKGRTAKSAAYLWVAGQGFASWQVTNDDTIALVADKEKYEVGETAEVLVPAPFVGATGLVTIERGKVITRSVRQFGTNSERLQIPITDHSVPNIFVAVVLYRPPTAEDPVPRYKVGYVELQVSTATRVLKVAIRPDREQAKPGETVHYDIKVTDSTGKGVKAEVSVAVIDKALLALEDERGPDGLKAFWFQRGLAVSTASSMSVSVNRSNDVIAEPPRQGKGGGGLDDDRLRQDFRNTAYWAAQLVTIDDGTASVDVKMPDNLTTWRMQVRAVSGDTMVGEGTNELISTQPLLLRPALPRFLRVGDSAQIRMLVRNATAKESEVKVTLKAEGITMSGDEARSAKVPAGQSVVLSWPAKVEAEGTAKFTFTATGSGGLKDAVTQELPVLMDVTPETTATGGIVTEQSGLEAVYLPPFAILKHGSLTVSVQSALAGSMAAELSWLAPQQYEGTERVASRLMATIGVRRAEKSALGKSTQYEGRISTDAAGLVGRQRPDGGWAWCDEPACNSDPNVTGWALLALGEVRRDGTSVDAGVVSRASEYVRGQINRVSDVASPADPNQKAFLLAALSAAGGGDSALTPARAVFEQYRSKLTNWGRAYLVLAMVDAGIAKDDTQVRALLNDIAAATIPSSNGNHWEDDYVRGSFMTHTATTALVARALVAVQPEQPLLAQTVRWLVVARGAEQWRTNVDRATGVLAMTSYAVQTGELGGDYSFKVSLDDKELMAGLVKPGVATVSDSKTVALSGIRAGEAALVEFAKEIGKPGRLYYTMNLRYVTPAKEVEALNRGFAVSHEYTSLTNPSQPVSRVKLGDTVRVTVTVLTPADRNYVVVEDMLPAGLEPVDTRLKVVDPKLKVQLEADRAAAAKKRAGEKEGYFAPWFSWYYSPWQHVDVRDDRTVLFAERLGKGVYEYIYYARATTPGDFFVAPTHAEETYFPETFGRGDSGRLVVEE
ncbi:MAG: alpha-2-macroglobulin family protein, partial [Anaerolineaceae bacterium]